MRVSGTCEHVSWSTRPVARPGGGQGKNIHQKVRTFFFARGFAGRTLRMVGAMTSDARYCTQWHPLSAVMAMTRCASARAVPGACKTFTVEELLEPTLDSLKSNLRIRAESTSSRPGRCTAMIVETLAGLGMIAPACQ